MSSRKSKSSGNGVHVFPVRVYYEDTDAGGIVYYANYLKFAERARTEMLREAGIESRSMMARDGVAFAVRRCSMDFKKPAKLDDDLSVETRIKNIGGASLVADQRVKLGQTELVTMELKLACVSMDGRPARMPEDIKSRIANMVHG